MYVCAFCKLYEIVHNKQPDLEINFPHDFFIERFHKANNYGIKFASESPEFLRRSTIQMKFSWCSQHTTFTNTFVCAYVSIATALCPLL